MFQLTWLKPYCQICLRLVLLAVILDLMLGMIDAKLAWLPRAVTGTGYLEDSRLRIAQAVQEYHEGRIEPHDHLAAIIGISNVRVGVELSVIADAAGSDWRFLGLGGAGFGIADVAQYARLVLDSELRPDLAVLGFGLHQLIDIRHKPRPADVDVMDNLRRGNLRSAAVALRNSTWIYSRREDISVIVESAVLDLRGRLFTTFGVALPQAEARNRSPWREMIKSDWAEHFSAATLKAQEQFYADLGMFDRETYENSPGAMSTLMDVIERFRLRRTKVILLLMPERSTLNRRIPAEALNVLKRQLGRNFPGDEPPILDFRNVVDDSGFVDLPHLNRKGSREFSRRLGDRLHDLLPNGAPLMAIQSETPVGIATTIN